MTKKQRIARDYKLLTECRHGLSQVYVGENDLEGKRERLAAFGFEWRARIDGKGRPRGRYGRLQFYSVIAEPAKCSVAWDLILELGLTPHVIIYRSPREIAAAKAERKRRRREELRRQWLADTARLAEIIKRERQW